MFTKVTIFNSARPVFGIKAKLRVGYWPDRRNSARPVFGIKAKPSACE